MVIQVSLRVMANDQAISMAAAHGEFELNAFLPLIADSLLESLALLLRAVSLFQAKCVALLKPDEEQCARHLEASYAFATDYTPRLGHDVVAGIIEKYRGDRQKIRRELEARAAAMDTA